MKTRTRVLLLATVAVAIAGWGTLEVAGQVGEPLPVVTYHTCVAEEDGTLYGFTKAEAPIDCADGDSEASLSSGDVTEVAGGEGLSGGAKSGPATLGIATGYRLPQDCGQGDSIAYEGGEWGCLAPLDLSAFAKSDQTCPPGSVASGVDLFGKLVCVEQSAGGRPSTDWTGLSFETGTATSERRRWTNAEIHVYNPNAETAHVSVHAFDFDGRELPRGGPSGAGACRALPVVPGGSVGCLVSDDRRAIGPGIVYVHADLPVLPFGEHRERHGAGNEHRWQLDWYPFCPEHVGTCDG